jgi:hypothetical protein
MLPGVECFNHLHDQFVEAPALLLPTLLKVTVGATIAFAMEISEFLVVTYTSSLTLSIAGIFKASNINILQIVHHGSTHRRYQLFKI